MGKIFWTLFLTGVLFGAGPCLASCGPLLVSYVVSTEKKGKNGIIAYLVFSIARILTYLFVSFAVYLLGNFLVERFFREWLTVVRMSAALLIMGIGALLLLGKNAFFRPARCLYDSCVEKNTLSVFMLGLAVGILPCAPLLALFSYMGLIARTMTQSLMYGLVFGLGTLFSPLLLLVFISGLLNKHFLDKDARLRKIINVLGGITIVILGLQLLLGTYHA